MKLFPKYLQHDSMDCGPACLQMVAKYFGRIYSLQFIRTQSFITRAGVSLLGISDAAESIGFHTQGVKLDFETLVDEVQLPCIVHWNQNHFIVVYKIKKKTNNNIIVYVVDPAHGRLNYTQEEFKKGWVSGIERDKNKGIALLLNPTPKFYELKGEKRRLTPIIFLLNYLKPFKLSLIKLLLLMFLGSIIQLILPFLTQAVVDTGIGNRNLGFVTLILVTQLALFSGKMSVDFLRGWILLHVSTKLNISLISDFLIKLMQLPIAFFDSKMIGDIMQRIGDHSRIQNFMTGSSLSTLFSMINLIVFGCVLGYYDLKLLSIFLLGNLLYFLWVTLFLHRRRDLDFKRFAMSSENQSNLFQLITGMQEIKLNNCEKQKRWKWERIQDNLFKISIKSLSLNQYQQIGSLFLSQTTTIFIAFLAAREVIQGEITLGMMMAITFIVGQVSAPIDQMIGFIQSLQDAKMSLERLGEIQCRKNEEPENSSRLTKLKEKQDIEISNLTFRYEGPHSPLVLDDISLRIPYGKVTAIVGTSGSGKTTFLKLLLGFYEPQSGSIKIGEHFLCNINSAHWRSKCGVVMQDGFIFSESIADNIAPGGEELNFSKVKDAAKVANIHDYIESLPLGYNTKIGQEGSGISQGQKQRLLIARAVYKNPEYLFFDEATNALDANNESTIMKKLDQFFAGKTVIVVAHRLSTVKHADQIILLRKGQIFEKGNHESLIDLRGSYYELVKNQLDVEN